MKKQKSAPIEGEPLPNAKTGYICLYRSIRKNWIWSDPVKFQWWVDILLEVNHKDQKVLIGSTLIDCKRGQSVNSLQTWAKRWRTDKSATRRFFKLLEIDNMLTLENVSKTTRITVCNYDSYNGVRNDDETIMKRSRNDDETQATPNNNDNNENNVKKGAKVVLDLNPFEDNELNILWQQWMEHRRQKKDPLTSISAQLQIKKIKAHTVQESLTALEKAMEKNWTGIWFNDEPPKPNVIPIQSQKKMVL